MPVSRTHDIPQDRILEIEPPIDVNGAGNVAGIVEEQVFIAFDDAGVRLIEVLGEPFGAHQHFGVRVLRKRCSHGNREASDSA